MKGKRLDNVAVLKAIGVFLVILIHISASSLVEVKNVGFFMIFATLNQFSLCAVPLFIFASGFLLFHSYKNKEFLCGPFMRRRFTKIFVPYIIWSTFYYLLFVIRQIYFFDIFFYIKNLIIGDHLYHLYFVIIILQFYLLFPIFLRLGKRFSYKWGLTLALIVQIILSKLPYFQYKDRFFLTYIFFFFLGIYASKHLEYFEKLILKWKYLIFLIFLIMGIVNVYYTYEQRINERIISSLDLINRFIIFGLVGILFYYLLSMYISKIFLKKVFLEISNASFYVYLAHPLGIILVNYLCKNDLSIGTIEKSMLSIFAILIIVIPLSISYVYVKKYYQKEMKNRI